MNFVTFDYTDAHRNEAIEIARNFKKTKHLNHTGGDSRARGVLAEIAFVNLFPSAQRDTKFRQDFWLGPNLFNVKSNSCTVPPKPHHFFWVMMEDFPEYDARGTNLLIAKLSIEKPPVYFVGWIPLAQFSREAHLIRRGEAFIFADSVCVADCCVLQIEKLNPMDTLCTDGDLFSGEFCAPLSSQ